MRYTKPSQMPRFPKRPASHVAADDAIQLFLASCPKEWVASPIERDYGLDLRIEVSRNGEVTGEEFFVQVKGRQATKSKDVTVRISQPTINYWLEKIHPVMIVLVDLSRRLFWFDWLENAYRPYPQQQDGSQPVALRLAMNSVVQSLSEVVPSYLERYFSALRQDIVSMADTGHMAKLLLHTTALARASAKMALSLRTEREWKQEEVDDLHNHFFLEFGMHDEFLWSLLETDSIWSRPLSGKAHAAVTAQLQIYVSARQKFWVREHRHQASDFLIVPVRWSDLFENLLPTLDALWDLEELLTQLIVLGRLVLPKNVSQPSQ